MLEFKRVNTTKMARQTGKWVYDIDILRQTTIERLVEHYSQGNNVTKVQLKKYIMTNVEILLDLMIQEK